MRLLIQVAPKALLVIAACCLPQLTVLHPLGWWAWAVLAYYPIYGLTLWSRRRSIDFQRTNHHNGYGYYQALDEGEMHEMALIQADIEGLILDLLFIGAGIGMGAYAAWF